MAGERRTLQQANIKNPEVRLCLEQAHRARNHDCKGCQCCESRRLSLARSCHGGGGQVCLRAGWFQEVVVDDRQQGIALGRTRQ